MTFFHIYSKSRDFGVWSAVLEDQAFRAASDSIGLELLGYYEDFRGDIDRVVLRYGDTHEIVVPSEAGLTDDRYARLCALSLAFCEEGHLGLVPLGETGRTVFCGKLTANR